MPAINAKNIINVNLEFFKIFHLFQL
jgi:hypothetical protein